MSAKYANAGQQRVLKVLDLLFGHEITGLAPGEIAKTVNANASAITRDLANLVEAGMAEEVQGTGRYRITPRLGSRALATLQTFDRAEKHLTDLKTRFIPR
ncbi:MAG: transcriptional regulator [Burkholderiaceae bacterium]|nr:transcriptional regulator [Burkholderiaceae bacterium]